jgi:hypothetical protein
VSAARCAWRISATAHEGRRDTFPPVGAEDQDVFGLCEESSGGELNPAAWRIMCGSKKIKTHAYLTLPRFFSSIGL